MDEKLIVWEEIVAMLWRRRATILAVFVSGVIASVVLAWAQGPTYRASAKIIVAADRARVMVSPDADERARVDPVNEYYLNSEMTLLSSTSLVREVLAPHEGRRLKAAEKGPMQRVLWLLSYPTRLPGAFYRQIHDLPPDDPFESWVDHTASKIDVSVVRKSNLIEVAYSAGDPAWAAGLVNGLVDRHVERHVRLNQQEGAHQFYQEQRDVLHKRLQVAEEGLRKFYEEEGIDSLGERETLLRGRLATLEAAISDSGTELAETTARADFLEKALQSLGRVPAGEAPIVPTQAAQLIQNRIIELELERSQMLSQFAATSIRIQDIDRRISEAKGLLAVEERGGNGRLSVTDPTRAALETQVAEAKAQRVAIQARLQSLRANLSDCRAQLEHLESIDSEPRRLEQEVAAAKQSLLTYVKKAEEARFSSALDESGILNVKVVERATIPAAPEPSARALTVALGMVLSLCVGIGLGFARDRLDRTVKSTWEASHLSGLRLLADIPS